MTGPGRPGSGGPATGAGAAGPGQTALGNTGPGETRIALPRIGAPDTLASPAEGAGCAIPGLAPGGMPVLDTTRSDRNAQTRGILLLLGSIFAFTLMDASGKYLTQTYNAGLVVWARFAGALAILLVFYGHRLRSSLKSNNPRLQLARALTQLASIGLFMTSLAYIGLAEATAIMDVNPVLITLFAALFLGEAIGIRRIAGIALALTGALIIIRPGSGVLHPAAVLPLIGAFTYAAGAILTRMLRADPTITSIMWTAVLCTAATSLMLPWFWQPIAPGDLWAFAALGVFGTIAQALLVKALSVAEASTIAPFGYTGLIWAGLWSWLFWDQIPDRWTLTGAALIVGAGIYVWAREARSR